MSIYIQLFMASLFWGSNVIVMKLLLDQIPFLLLASIRVFLSLVCLTIYLKWKKISLHHKNHFQIIVIATMAIYLNFFFTFLGMNEVKGIDNAFMNALAPVLTYFFGICVLRNKGSFKELIAIFLSVFAFLLSIRFRVFDIQKGFWYLFLGMLLYILANVFIQKWKLENSLVFLFYELLYGFIFLCIHCLIVGQFRIHSLYSISLWYWFLFILISGIGFAYIQVIYIKAIGIIGALKTSFFLGLNPIVTYIESLVFLNEMFDWIHFIGFMLLSFSIYLIRYKKEEVNFPRNNE